MSNTDGAARQFAVAGAGPGSDPVLVVLHGVAGSEAYRTELLQKVLQGPSVVAVRVQVHDVCHQMATIFPLARGIVPSEVRVAASGGANGASTPLDVYLSALHLQLEMDMADPTGYLIVHLCGSEPVIFPDLAGIAGPHSPVTYLQVTGLDRPPTNSAPRMVSTDPTVLLWQQPSAPVLAHLVDSAVRAGLVWAIVDPDPRWLLTPAAPKVMAPAVMAQPRPPLWTPLEPSRLGTASPGPPQPSSASGPATPPKGGSAWWKALVSMAAAAGLGITLLAVMAGRQNGSDTQASVPIVATSEPVTAEVSTSEAEEPVKDISVGQCFDVTYSDWEDDTEFANDEVPCFQAHTLEVVDVYYGWETIDELSAGCSTSVNKYLGYTRQDKKTAVHRFTAAVRSPGDDSPTVCVVAALRDELASSETRFYSFEESLTNYVIANGWKEWALCRKYDQNSDTTAASGKCGNGAKWIVLTAQQALGDRSWPGKKNSKARADSFCRGQLDERASSWFYQSPRDKDWWNASDWSARCWVAATKWSDQT